MSFLYLTRRIGIMCTAHYVPTPPPPNHFERPPRPMIVFMCVCVLCVRVCVWVCVCFCVCMFFWGMIFSTFGDINFFPNNITSVDFYRLRWAKTSLSLQFLIWREIISSKTTAKNHNFNEHLNARLISANTIQFTPILVITIRSEWGQSYYCNHQFWIHSIPPAKWVCNFGSFPI